MYLEALKPEIKIVKRAFLEKGLYNAMHHLAASVEIPPIPERELTAAA